MTAPKATPRTLWPIHFTWVRTWRELLDRPTGDRYWGEILDGGSADKSFICPSLFPPSSRAKPHLNSTIIRPYACGHRLDSSLHQQRADRFKRLAWFRNSMLETSTDHPPTWQNRRDGIFISVSRLHAEHVGKVCHVFITDEQTCL